MALHFMKNGYPTARPLQQFRSLGRSLDLTFQLHPDSVTAKKFSYWADLCNCWCGSMYRPIQYVDYQSMPGCTVSRRTSRSAKNDMFSSRYGTRKDKHGLRCEQYDDAPCHRFGTGYGGCRFTAANNRGSIRRSFPISSTPKRQAPRFHELANVKKSGCGPNCKYSRCAANDPCYDVPFCTLNERQDRRSAKKIGQIPSPSLLRSTCSRMAQIQEISKRVVNNISIGLKYLQEVQDTRNLDVLPMFELSCDGNCAERSDTPRASIRGRAGHGDGIPERISTRTPNETGLKSLTTKTVASNTEESCYDQPESHEVPTRALKDVNCNSTLKRLNKQTSPIPIEKTLSPTPIPRVTLLRPPRPAPPQNITKKDQQMIRYALQQEQLLTPQPKHEHVVPSPPKPEASPPIPLHGHEAPPTPGPKATPLPPPLIPLYGYEAPPQVSPELPPFHSLETSTPVSLTSPPETPPSRMHPQRQKWLPRKLSPRLHTPPIVKMTYPSRTPSISPRPQSAQQNQSPPSPPPKPPPPVSSPTPPPSPLQSHPTSPPPVSTTQAISPLTSDYDSHLTTTTNSDSGSGTPTACQCSLCGKSENADTMKTVVYKYNNNPLYNLASPLQSPTGDVQGVVTVTGRPSRVRFVALEVIILLVLGGLVTLGLMSFVESLFGVYLAGNCGCSSGGGKGPHLMADGLKSGVVNWVTCPMDESRVKFTPVR